MTNTFQNYSINAGNNNNTPPDGMPEGMQAGLVNDSWRKGKEYERRTWGDHSGEDGAGNDLASGGTASNYTLTITQDFSAYHPGMNFTFRANHANTGASTLTVTTPSGALAQVGLVRSDGSNTVADDIRAGQWVTVKYDATNSRFHLLSAFPGGASVEDVQIGRYIYLTNVGGTANAVTAQAEPTLTKYTEGQQVRLKAVAENTGAVTLNIDGVGAANVKNSVGNDIPAGGWFIGRMITLTYDGSAWIDDLATVAKTPQMLVFTTSGTYTPTAGISFAKYKVTGGGGGARGGTTGGFPGGSAAGTAMGIIDVSNGTPITVTVGQGGAGGAAGSNNGTDGGESSLGTIATSPGGLASTTATNNAPRGTVATGGDVNVGGGDAGYGQSNNGGFGGASYWGGNAVPAQNGAGVDGQAPGCGGSGPSGSNPGGSGADGIVVIEELY